MSKICPMLMTMVIVLFLLLICASGDESNPVICKITGTSNDKLLPFESLGVLVTLQNTTNETQKVSSSFNTPFLRFRYPDSSIKPGPHPNGTPLINNFVTLSPKGSTFSHIIIGHAFHEQGIKVSVEATWARISSRFEVNVDVPVLSGRDKEAYEFLKSGALKTGFYKGQGALADTQENLSAMKQFIKDYNDSRYTNLAHLGLAFLYWRMSKHTEYDEATESWLPIEGAEKNFKNAKHTFKKLINEYKEKKGEKREVDDEDKEDERDDDDNDDKKAAVDKNTFLWASYYLGQLYEEEAFRVTKNTEEASENKRDELHKHALKYYVYALTQEPNEYYKFILTEAKTRVEKELESYEKGKKEKEAFEKEMEEMRKRMKIKRIREIRNN